MQRYGFSIKTRSGHRVDHISIMAVDEAHAQQRLLQMYRDCEVVNIHVSAVSPRTDALDVEAVIGLISSEPAEAPALRTLRKAAYC